MSGAKIQALITWGTIGLQTTDLDKNRAATDPGPGLDTSF